MTAFRIRTYSIQELGILYFRHNTPESASAHLRRWMLQPQLYEKLAAAGYRRGQKILTPRQVRIIVDHVGKP
ncbi:MAG: DUF4248 domain-containing protein [Clostridiales bacterium]|nr:DUF4248 domain-containing protein [Clostridiales bacterium]MCC8134561.1 DUF4248 domain-containing protein [Tannerellaceae bacterium]MCC8199044.1 DUF4248 domain-containing protein [Tannerellaceae bacterium]